MMVRGQHSPVRVLVGLAAACLLAAAPLGAQSRTPPLPPGMTGEEVVERIRESGITRDQARARLATLGYDPSLADAYFDRLEGGAGPVPAPGGAFLRALQALGLAEPGLPAMGRDTLPRATDTLPDSLGVRLDSLAADSLRVFGREVFTGPTTEFQPILFGPVDPGYRLGPGDQLGLVLTGDVELAYTLDVRREGFVVIPDVGQVFVSGLTLEQLRDQLYARLGRVYSGVHRGPDATTFFDVTLGTLRTNQVFVIGDVTRPGAQQVSAAATVFHALHRAGGPTDLGSFRSILVRRAGGRVAAEVDLYDYLLRGDASSDVRLENGDIVFVPPAGAQVAVQGKVRRPAIYEVREGEGLRDALAFAGGLEADAHVQRVQIDRVLAPAERIPGVDRVLMDVDLGTLMDPGGEVIALRPGDEVRVFASLVERRNRVALAGSVYRPGLYEYRAGMTVWDLIQRADGLSEEAFRPVAHVFRPLMETGAARLLRVSLQRDDQGRPLDDLPLQDRDSVVVYGMDSLVVAEHVTVEGLVKQPGRYRLAAGMTVEDLILAAGGFQEGANTHQAEVARLTPGYDRRDTLAVPMPVAIRPAVPDPTALRPLGDNGAGSGLPAADEFELQHLDRVFVRRLPGYVTPETVVVQGEVQYPGPYAIQQRDERLSGMVARSGGLTGEAYVPGARLLRDSVLVGIDLVAALERPGGQEDVVLEPGDQLVVPQYDPTVLVTGAVAFESRVIYREGRDLDDYLRQAGGSLPEADLDRVSVLYMSGERATARSFLWHRSFPEVQPGSTIIVPAEAEGEGTNWDQVLTRTLSITGTILTILLAVDRLGS